MQVCTSLQTDNHASTPPVSFLQAGFPSCHPTDSVKALKATVFEMTHDNIKTAKILKCLKSKNGVITKIVSKCCIPKDTCPTC